jgi:hypothetical protein
MAERAQPLPGTAAPWRAEIPRSGCRRLANRVLAHVRTSGGPTGPAQSVFRRPRSSPPLCSGPSLTRSNRRGTDPYARWCGRGDAARRPPIPINTHAGWSSAASRRHGSPTLRAVAIRLRSGRESRLINRTGKLRYSWRSAVMHFYSGLPMHLLSGVDTSTRTASFSISSSRAGATRRPPNVCSESSSESRVSPSCARHRQDEELRRGQAGDYAWG